VTPARDQGTRDHQASGDVPRGRDSLIVIQTLFGFAVYSSNGGHGSKPTFAYKDRADAKASHRPGLEADPLKVPTSGGCQEVIDKSPSHSSTSGQFDGVHRFQLSVTFIQLFECPNADQVARSARAEECDGWIQ
jgi:hypothetical protein